jgi:hypothetical protein
VLDTFLNSPQLGVGAVFAVLAVGAYVVFTIIKKTIMLALATLLAVTAAGGIGAYYLWQ